MLNNSDANQREALLTEEQWKAVVLRDRLLGIGGFLLALAIFGVAWYVYPRLRSQTEANTQIKSVQTAVDGLGDRMKAAESKFESQSNEQQDLHNQVTNLGRRLSARIENARREVQQSSAEMFRQAQTRIDDQIRGVEARMTRLESSSSDANTQVAELRRELGQVRGEMANRGMSFGMSFARSGETCAMTPSRFRWRT